jgi:hypothetical protein
MKKIIKSVLVFVAMSGVMALPAYAQSSILGVSTQAVTPTPTVAAATTTASSSMTWIIIPIVIVVLLIGLVIFFMRRRQSN